MGRSIKEKSLIYAASEVLFNVVDVIEEDHYLLVRVQDPYSPGIYYRVALRKTQEIKDKIAHATKDLEWRAEGNEFPTPK